MVSVEPLHITARRAFAYLMPGVGWLTFGLIVSGDGQPVPALLRIHENVAPALGGDLAWTGLLVLVVFLVGAIMSPLNFGVAALVGDGSDRLLRGVFNHLASGLRDWLVERRVVPVVTLKDLRQRLEAWLCAGGIPLLRTNDEPGAWWASVYKRFVLARSSVLGQRALDIEAEANLFAGLGVSAGAVGIALLWSSKGWAFVALAAASLALSRCQQARHHELFELIESYATLWRQQLESDSVRDRSKASDGEAESTSLD